jgi:flagellar biosynthesis protein FliQ
LTQELIIGLGQQAVVMMVLLAGPLLAVSLVVGLVVSIFQAVTQVNEMTLTFVPKVIAIFAVLILLGPWMLQMLLGYTANTFAQMATFAH